MDTSNCSHLVTIGYPQKRRVLDDSHYRDNERVGAADDRRQPGPEEGLQQRVYPRHEKQRLHHPDPVPLQTATPITSERERSKHHITKLMLPRTGTNLVWPRIRRHDTGSHIVATHHGNQHRWDHHRGAQRQYVVLEAQYDRLA